MFVTAALLLASPVGAVADGVLAVKGGKVVTMAGDPIVGGTVLIKDGKIAAVGKDVAIPTEAKVIDATGKVVLPGFVDVHSSRGSDQPNERNANVANLTILDALDPSQEYFEECRRNGVTTIAAAPGDATMFGQQASIVKSFGGYVDEMVVKRNFAIKISLRPTADRSRMSQLAAIRKELSAAREIMQKDAESKAPAGKADGNKADAKKPDEKKSETGKSEAKTETKSEAPAATPQQEVLIRALKGELRVYVACEKAMDVPQALKLVADFKLKAILVLGEETYKAANLVARSGLPIVLDPTLAFWETDPRTGEDRHIVIPRLYAQLKAPVCFQTTGFAAGTLFRASDLPATVGTNYLWFQAATAIKHGMSEADALKAITIQPATWLGVEKLVGSLEVGKDGDLAVLSGDPFKFDTWVDYTVIGGSVAYERAKDKKLEQLLTPKKD
jgi:imidazolonepropionase-like amidohydrolase